MRITNNMLISNSLYYINKNLERIEKLQAQESSGEVIQAPSDDPVRASRILKLGSYIAEAEQYQENVDDALSWMTETETALSSMEDVLEEMRTLVNEAANGTMTDSDLENIKAQIEEMEKELIDQTNSSYNGRYIFAGYDTDEAPLETVETDVGDFITYKGKYLSLGGPFTSGASDSEIETFIEENFSDLYGLAELEMGSFESFTATTPALSFDITLDGVTTTINLTDGVTYDLDSIVSEIQTQLDAAFPSGTGDPDPIIEVSADDGKIKFTVLSGDTIEINSSSLDVSVLGFTDDSSATKDDDQGILYQVGSESEICINVEGNDILGQSTTGLFETIAKIKMALDGETSCRTAAVDGADITITTEELDLSDLIGSLDENISNLLTVTAALGARMDYAETVQTNLEDSISNLTELLSKSEDVDVSEVVVLVEAAQNVYDSSLSVASKVIQNSLIDYIA